MSAAATCSLVRSGVSISPPGDVVDPRLVDLVPDVDRVVLACVTHS